MKYLNTQQRALWLKSKSVRDLVCRLDLLPCSLASGSLAASAIILAYLTVENADFNAELYGEQAYPRNGHDESI